MLKLSSMRVVNMSTKSAQPIPTRPIRVCFMIDKLSTAGTETQLLALIHHLDRSRVSPYLCLLGGESEFSRALEPKDCPVLRLGVRSFKTPGWLWKAGTFRRFLRQNDIDVLQVYFPQSSFLGVLVGWLSGVPHIVRTRNNLGYSLTWLHRLLGRLCNPLTDGTVANCEACRQAVMKDEGLSLQKTFILENGVNLERFPKAIVERPPRHKQNRKVGVVGNLRPVKNLDLFIRAAARVQTTHPNVTFHVAGEGELRSSLQHLASELGIVDKVFMPGTVSNIPEFLADLDVAVLCSKSEGMSNAVLEYMAAGKPIVATEVGGNRQLIENGKTGLLIPPGDDLKLADAIRTLLDDENQANRMAKAARLKVEEHHSREVMVRRFEDFYVNLMNEQAFFHS
jgi:glycosyltransferase involved in cell wall biosynthesis